MSGSSGMGRNEPGRNAHEANQTSHEVKETR